MERKFTVGPDFVANLLVLQSELDTIIQDGVNIDTMEIIESCHELLTAQLQTLQEVKAA